MHPRGAAYLDHLLAGDRLPLSRRQSGDDCLLSLLEACRSLELDRRRSLERAQEPLCELALLSLDRRCSTFLRLLDLDRFLFLRLPDFSCRLDLCFLSARPPSSSCFLLSW